MGLHRTGRLVAPLVALGVALSSGPVGAEVYDVPILVETEEDILDLFSNGDLTEGERDLLLDLIEKKVDLNRAGRDDLFELPGITYPMADAIIEAREARGGWFASVSNLEDVVGLPSDVLAQIRVFLYVVSRTPPPPPIGGSVRVKVAEAIGDEGGPVAYLRLRLDGWDDLVGFGYVGIVHEAPGQPRFVDTGAEQYMIADASAYTYEYAPKVYLWLDTELWDKARGAFIIGSYNAGFGERLVLDTTTRRRPYGWYSDDLVSDSIDTRKVDFNPRKGLFGAAAQLTEMHLTDDVWMDVTALFSWWRYHQYMYDYQPNRTYFSDEDADGGEKSCYGEGRCFAYETFPNVYDELLVGGNWTTRFGGRAHFGVTGYWAKTHFQFGDGEVHWAPSASLPYRDSFWTIGADAAWGTGIVDLFFEYARTDNGGNGAVLRSMLDLEPVDLEIALRYYDDTYDNPHGRGEAAPDELLGRRARDEVGGRVRMVAKAFRWWKAQAVLNVWNHPTIDRTDLEASTRQDFEPIRELRLSTWVKYNDKDLTEGGREQDYGLSTDIDLDSAFETFLDEGLTPDEAAVAAANEASTYGQGMKVDWGLQTTLRAIPLTTITAYYKMSWKDIKKYEDKFQTDYSTWLRIGVRPVPFLGFSTRVKLANEDIESVEEDTDGDGVPDQESGDEWVEWYARVDFNILKYVKGYVRYDLRWFFDASPPERNPEHVIRGVVDVKF